MVNVRGVSGINSEAQYCELLLHGSDVCEWDGDNCCLISGNKYCEEDGSGIERASGQRGFRKAGLRRSNS